MAEYTHPDALVETEWLADRLDDRSIRVVEVDEDTTAYEKGHIRNSIGWNWFEDLHAQPRRDYVDQDGLNRLLQEAGVGADTTVVLYGGNNNWFAAYAYW
jgi:thiosulfate/3-mercaptopyruvate sulfurtransferase